MYNEELEHLIVSVLEDGEITEQERKVLRCKAEALGADPDEIEVEVDARLAKMKKESASRSAATTGRPHKCPSCGAMLQPMQTVCPECGQAVSGVQAVNSAKALFNELQQLEKDKRESLYKAKIYERPAIEHDFNEQKASVIKNFPVPNTKEDLLELLALAASNAYDNDGVIGSEEEVWLQKTDQIYRKVVMIGGNDQETLDQATTVIVSLMKRLPNDYKNFTALPREKMEEARSEMEDEKNRITKLRIQVLTGKISLCCYVTLLLGLIVTFIPGDIAFLGILLMIGGAIAFKKIVWPKFKNVRENPFG